MASAVVRQVHVCLSMAARSTRFTKVSFSRPVTTGVAEQPLSRRRGPGERALPSHLGHLGK